MYQKGDFTKYINKIKRLVRKGDITKAEANIMILGKVQQILANLTVTKDQFILDRTMEVSYERN